MLAKARTVLVLRRKSISSSGAGFAGRINRCRPWDTLGCGTLHYFRRGGSSPAEIGTALIVHVYEYVYFVLVKGAGKRYAFGHIWLARTISFFNLGINGLKDILLPISHALQSDQPMLQVDLGMQA